MSGIAMAAAVGSGFPGQINGSLPNGGATDTTASFGINSDGTTTISGQSSVDWVTPTTVAGQYQVRVDPTSGTFDSGTTGTWLDCSTSPSWTVLDPGGLQVETVVFDIAFRPTGGATQSTQTGVQLAAISTS